MFTRLILITLAILAVGACTDDGPTQAEFNDTMEGITVDPATYELTVVSCINDGEFIDYTWGLTNLSDEPKTYAFDPHFKNLDGIEEEGLRELVAEEVGPAEYAQWSGFAGGGERFPVGDIECRFEVVDSALGLFRDEG